MRIARSGHGSAFSGVGASDKPEAVHTWSFKISILVYAADIQDRNGAVDFPLRLSIALPVIASVFADEEYAGDELMKALIQTGELTLDIIKRSSSQCPQSLTPPLGRRQQICVAG